LAVGLNRKKPVLSTYRHRPAISPSPGISHEIGPLKVLRHQCLAAAKHDDEYFSFQMKIAQSNTPGF
ncbi:MAG: hypothetical protein WCB70_03430, partial [Xanthobacteraceae bacterium]